MLKICLIIPSLQSGGMERVMSELAGYFVGKKEVEVHMVLYGRSREIFYPIPDDIKIYKPSFIFTAHSRIISSLKTLLFLRTTVRKINPNTILSFGEYWNSFLLVALLGLKFPIYISDRCRPNKSLGRMHDWLRKWLYPKASGIVAQTSKAKEIYAEQGLNANIRVIANPIHIVPPNGNETPKQNIVLTVGRLIKTKHHDRLIKMFKVIQPAGWKLVIVGGDALKQEGMHRLKSLVDELDMNNCVELTGTVADIDSYYQKSKIFAFTSSSEGFPNAIGEAMSAGLPVIAYNCIAGPSDLVDDGNTGFLIPPFEDEEYVERLRLLVNNIDLRTRMGSRGQEKVSEFEVTNIAKEFYSFILSSEQIVQLEVSGYA